MNAHAKRAPPASAHQVRATRPRPRFEARVQRPQEVRRQPERPAWPEDPTKQRPSSTCRGCRLWLARHSQGEEELGPLLGARLPTARPPPHRPSSVLPGEPAPKRPFTTGRSGRLDILEFNKLVLDMRLERDEPMGSSRQAIRAPTADQPLGGYGGYGYGGGYGGQEALPLPHGGTADQPLLGGGRSAGLAPDIPLGSRGSRGSLQARPGVAPADQPLGLAGGRAGVAPEHRTTADEPLPIGGRSGFAPGYRPEADQPLGGRAGYAPTYRTGLN